MRTLGLVLLALSLLAAGTAAQVTVVSTSPANGAKNVDPSTSELRVKFSAPVRPDGYAFVTTGFGEEIESTGKPRFEESNTVCVLPIRLLPGTKYAVSINSQKFNSFRSAADANVPVTPYLIAFTTSGQPPTSRGPKEVTVTRTYPENGAKDVDPKTEFLRVRFSAPVSPDGWSFVTTGYGKEIPSTGKPKFEDDNKLVALPIKLEPGTTYSVSINSETYRTFRSAEDPKVAVTPYLLTFTTAGKAPRKGALLPPDKWREDLAYLASELPKRHIKLFAKLTEEQFKKEVSDFDQKIPSLGEDEIMVGFSRLVASVGDEHTGIGFSGGLTTLPLGLYWFKDGIFVTSAAEDCKKALRCRVEKIGGVEIDKACTSLAPLVPHANDAATRNSMPYLLTVAQFLRGTQIISDTDRIPVQLRPESGEPFTIELTPLEYPRAAKWVDAVEEGKDTPLYRAHRKKPYWADYLGDKAAIYFLYNSCSESRELPFAKFQADLERLMSSHPSAKLVIDVRNNSGGNSAILDPFIDLLKGNKDFDRKGKLFVIVGRRTFSSAVMNAVRLRQETKSIVVGEPTAGSVNHYGEVKTFELPNSKASVFYSTKYFHNSDKDEPTVTPDVLVELTSQDFFAGRDPVLDAVLEYQAK